MSRIARSDLVDIEVCLHHETQPADENAGAYLVSLDGDRDNAVWVQKSRSQFEHKTKTVGILSLSEALAVEKGLR